MSKVFEQLVNNFSLCEHCTCTPQPVKSSTLDPYKVVVINKLLAFNSVHLIFSCLYPFLHYTSEESLIMIFFYMKFKAVLICCCLIEF